MAGLYIKDLDVLFSMNDASLLPLGYERCLEELSGLIPKGEIVLHHIF